MQTKYSLRDKVEHLYRNFSSWVDSDSDDAEEYDIETIMSFLEDYKKEVINDTFTHFLGVLIDLAGKPGSDAMIPLGSVIDLAIDMQKKLKYGKDKI